MCYTCKLLIITLSCLLFSCSSNKMNVKKNNQKKISNAELVKQLDNKFDELSSKIIQTDSLNKLLINRSIDYKNLVEILNEKMENLDNKIISIDSIYNQVSSSLLLIEDNITLLSKSYNEISQLENNSDVKDVSILDEHEFKQIYIESLALYQNGEWASSLDGFSHLLSVGGSINLLDNCQYWIGEIYFKLKDYHLAINAFEKVFEYIESNKRDDALYKLSKCYASLGNSSKSNILLEQLIIDFPNSEYVKKAKRMIKN